MSDQRGGGITWTDETWNVIRGCRRVNGDCINCYAERLAATRLSHPPTFMADGHTLIKPGGAYWGLAEMTPVGPRWTGKIDLADDRLLQPVHWTRPRLVFVNAMSDLFYDDLPTETIDRIVAVMWMAHQHTFQVLTKRWARMADYLSDPRTPYRIFQASMAIFDTLPKHTRRRIAEGVAMEAQMIQRPMWPIWNIWWGGSAGHQKALDEAGPHLLRCRPHAKILWLSAEPLWAPLSIAKWLPHARETSQTREEFYPGVDWVVGGGESGPGARVCHPGWARQLRDECLEAGVSFHWKQWGEWMPDDQGAVPRTGDNCVGAWDGWPATGFWKVGKKAAGRLLDGVVHDSYPVRRAV